MKASEFCTSLSIGVKKGDRVALSFPNCPEYIFSFMGASKAGAIVVPLNMMLTLEEIAYIIMESGANTLVVHPVIAQKVDKSQLGRLNLKNVVVLDENTINAILKMGPSQHVEIEPDEVCTYIYIPLERQGNLKVRCLLTITSLLM